MAHLDFLKGKKAVLVTHNFSLSGSPLLLVEVALEMQRSGCLVSMASLSDELPGKGSAADNRIPLLSLSFSFDAAMQADFVIVNTALGFKWINQFLYKYPHSGKKIIWWIHEIDTQAYVEEIKSFAQVGGVLFDSHASLKQWQGSRIAFPSLQEVIHLSVCSDFQKSTKNLRFPFSIHPIFSKLGYRPLLSRDQIRHQLKISKTDILVSLFSNYSENKGHDLFIQSILSLPDHLPLKYLIIGFNDKKQVAALLSNLNPFEKKKIDVKKLLLGSKDLRPFYKASDVFVMNSQGFGENFGRVTIEAMAFGLPILATQAGGTCEIVQEGVTGMMHPTEREGQNQLIENILYLQANPDIAKSMGQAGRKRIDHYFNDERFYKELGSFFKKILNKISN